MTLRLTSPIAPSDSGIAPESRLKDTSIDSRLPSAVISFGSVPVKELFAYCGGHKEKSLPASCEMLQLQAYARKVCGMSAVPLALGVSRSGSSN